MSLHLHLLPLRPLLLMRPLLLRAGLRRAKRLSPSTSESCHGMTDRGIQETALMDLWR